MLSIPELHSFFKDLDLAGSSAVIVQHAFDTEDVKKLNRLVDYFKKHYKELKKRSYKKRMRYVYDCSKSLSDRIYQGQHGITCGKGCNYCCHGSRISASRSEIRALVEHCRANDIAIDAKQVQYLIDDDGKFEGPFTALRCPFLKEDGCQVYEARPLSCRTKFSIDDPEKCNEDSDKWTGSFRFYADEELEMLKVAFHCLDEPLNFFKLLKELDKEIG